MKHRYVATVLTVIALVSVSVVPLIGQTQAVDGPRTPDGRPDLGRRDHQLPPGDELQKLHRQPTSRRTFDPCRPGHASLRIHGQRSDDVDETMDGPDSHEKE